MSGRRMNVLATGAIVIAVISGPLAGCSMIRFRNPFQWAERPVQPASAVDEPMVTNEDHGILDSVEEFLARTADYQLTDSAATSSRTVTPPPVESPPRTISGPTGINRKSAEPAYGGVAQRDGHSGALENTQIELDDHPPSGGALALPVIQSVSIHPAPDSQEVVEESVTSNSANAPLDVSVKNPSESVDQLLAHLEQRAVQESNFETEWPLRLTQLAFHRDTEAAQVSADLPQATRIVLEALVRTVLAIRSVARDPALASAEALERIDDLRRLLTDRADLSVTVVALCRKVVTFGAYEEMGDADFVAGRTVQAIVYSEISNLQSEETGDGRYRTRLATRLEVLTADGRSVWRQEEPDIVDLCRRRRTDFFVAQRISLPPTLSAGDYVLKVLIEDKLSGKADEALHPFAIGSMLSAAARHTARAP